MAFAASNTVNALLAAAPRTSRRTQRRASPVVAAQSGKAAVGPEAVKLGEQFGFTGVEVRCWHQGARRGGEAPGKPCASRTGSGPAPRAATPLRPNCSTEIEARDSFKRLGGSERRQRGHSARVPTE